MTNKDLEKLANRIFALLPHEKYQFTTLEKHTVVNALRDAAKSAEPPLTASVLADALECFWNAAIGSAHNAQRGVAEAGNIAEGFAAVARRLKEQSASPRWRPMTDAPKDRMIFVRRDNGCGADYAVVWWSDEGDKEGYPWKSEFNAYPVDRWDEWMLPPS